MPIIEFNFGINKPLKLITSVQDKTRRRFPVVGLRFIESVYQLLLFEIVTYPFVDEFTPLFRRSPHNEALAFVLICPLYVPWKVWQMQYIAIRFKVYLGD